MTIDPFMASLGMASGEVDDEARALMVDRAEEYIRAGGKPPPWSQWIALSEASREAWGVAAERVKAYWVATLAAAIRDDASFRALRDEIDGGQASASEAIDKYAARVLGEDEE